VWAVRGYTISVETTGNGEVIYTFLFESFIFQFTQLIWVKCDTNVSPKIFCIIWFGVCLFVHRIPTVEFFCVTILCDKQITKEEEGQSVTAALLQCLIVHCTACFSFSSQP
jgi:hypothetical protein